MDAIVMRRILVAICDGNIQLCTRQTCAADMARFNQQVYLGVLSLSLSLYCLFSYRYIRSICVAVAAKKTSLQQ